MKSAPRGKPTSSVEVRSLSPEGFWLLIDDRELAVPFKEFPWFRDATIREITTVERPSPHHIRWPALDIDLAVESLEHPERFPLVSRARASHKASQRKGPRRRIREVEAPHPSRGSRP